MYHHRKGIDRISGDSDIEFYDIILLVPEGFIVEARVSARETFEIIIEISYEFTHRYFIVENHARCIEIRLVFKYSTAFLRQCHEVSDIFIRSDHFDLGDWLFDMDIGTRFWEVFGLST
jgi:hypothetical protein